MNGVTPRETSKPDFSGLLSCGRHVVFEAKATMSATSFPFGSLAEHQAAALHRAYRWGAVSFVYVLDGHQRRWVLPWKEIEKTKLQRESYPFDDAPTRKREGETWLQAWERIEAQGMT